MQTCCFEHCLARVMLQLKAARVSLQGPADHEPSHALMQRAWARMEKHEGAPLGRVLIAVILTWGLQQMLGETGLEEHLDLKRAR